MPTQQTKFEHLEYELHRLAAEATGLEDFGDPAYLEGFRVLLRAFDTDPKLTEAGRSFASGLFVGTLIARLHTQRGWMLHPAVRQQRISRPIVITGLPRTGTTALHKLLSMDTQFQTLERWLTETPMMRPPREAWETLPPYRASVANLEAFFAAMPAMRKAHDMVADEPDECLEILRQSFISNRFASSAHVPSYDHWFQRQDERASYVRYADVLRLIGGAETDKQWLLKNPGHITQMACLLEVFPDARILHTHRDPLQAIPSLCSTLHMSRQMFEGEAARANVIGPRECEYWRVGLQRAEQVRRTHAGQFMDIDHRDFVADPMRIVKEIYAFCDLSISAAAQQRMGRWIADRPMSRHGEHVYHLEDFGLSEPMLGTQFAEYRQQRRFTSSGGR